MSLKRRLVEGGWLSPGNLLSFLQSAAIMGAACWTIFLFFSFERDERDLGLALLETQNLQTELTTELAGLQIEQAEIEIAEATQAQIKTRQEIEIDYLGPAKSGHKHLFSATYTYSILNHGNMRKEVTYTLVHSYMTQLPQLGDDEAIEINSVSAQQPLRWKHLLSKGCFYSAKWVEGKSFRLPSGQKMAFRSGGGGTAELDSGEASVGSLALVVVANPYDLIGFELHLGIEGGKTEANRWRYEKNEYLRIPEAEPTSGLHPREEET